MRPPHDVLRCFVCSVSLALAAPLALADHVAPVLPLTAGSNHTHEKFTPTVFPAADLNGIDLSFADLTNCQFSSGTNLTNANFTGARLFGATLAGCTLDNALFLGADLTIATLGCGMFADYRGAILTGVTSQNCSPLCGVRDACTVGNPSGLCLSTVAFRGIVSGVVFIDADGDGTLDYGELGIGGVSLTVTDGGGPHPVVTDGRGGYRFASATAVPSSVQLQTSSLPLGMTATPPTSYSFDLASCRSGQSHNFPVFDPSTPVKPSTFGRLKLLYR